jgi:Kef-type K+ transport system membrane component KefB
MMRAYLPSFQELIMDELSVLITFAVGLAGALIFGYVALRVKLSPIIGYLLGGIVVGPFTPGIFINRAIAEQFAEIGVILLLFGIRLRFQLEGIKRLPLGFFDNLTCKLSSERPAPFSVTIRI